TYQKSRLFLGLCVEDNLYLAALGIERGHFRPIVRPRRDGQLRERAREIAEKVGLAAKLRVLVGTLSHGEQRQLEVAMARVANPKLMLLDEPASGLSRGERTAPAGPPGPASEPLLAVRDLDAYYGRAHVLQGVSFEMGTEPLAIIGRNGMGKTTLCAAIMGITPPRTEGSVRFRDKELLGEPSYKVAKLGIGYVPQGRRLCPSLTVDE